jgi:phosphatidylglycerol:prolipoprotein diacylglycerol transferase
VIVHPILTTLELAGAQIPIGGYGVMLAIALIVGAAVALHSAARARLDLGGFVAALAAAVSSGFFGAAALFAAVTWLTTQTLPAGPGVVFYGGAIAGALGFALMARLHRLPLAAALDALLPALPIGHALGRIGCYLGGCCYGAAWSGPWAVRYLHSLAPGAHPSVPRHPWPLYEALVLVALAVVFALKSREWRPGRASAWYVLAYAVARFALEPLRGDMIRGVGWAGVLSTSQLISIVLALGASAVLAARALGATQLRV